MRLVAVTIGAGFVSSLTDWFFAGDWIHRRYSYPEARRQGDEIEKRVHKATESPDKSASGSYRSV